MEHRIQTENRAYYKYKSVTKKKEMSRKTKMSVYRSVVTNGAETTILTKAEEDKLRRFERKIVRKIYGPKKAVEGIYQRLMN